MDAGILGARNQRAQERILAAAKDLAEKTGIEPALVDGLTVQEKDRDVRAMKQREAVADLLERLVEISTRPVVEEEPEPVVSEPEEVIPSLAGVEIPPVEPAQEEPVAAPEKVKRGKGK
jgi:hypothetical protein